MLTVLQVPTCADPLSHASITVSSVVPLGAEIHVKLTIAAGHTGQVLGTADGDWVGLFRAGEVRIIRILRIHHLAGEQEREAERGRDERGKGGEKEWSVQKEHRGKGAQR